MNIIIPLGGKGERFSKNGYKEPKPLVKIFEKYMIEYVLDNLKISSEDKVFIIYNKNLDFFNFSNIISKKYPYIYLIPLEQDTRGAVETLYLGINYLFSNLFSNLLNDSKKCLLLDCDTFYTYDLLDIFRNSEENIVFFTKNYEKDPIYSYITLSDNLNITKIKEKEKISDNANTGCYAFTDIHILSKYCKYVLENGILVNNEPYTSCVISEMLRDGIIFNGHEINDKFMFSLGTPTAVSNYIHNTYGFLFDLDGTLVITDEIYYDVWYKILLKYNIILDREIFLKFIQGNNDKYVLNSLLINCNLSLLELSTLKDKLFLENINKIKIIDGVLELLKKIKMNGHKVCIVTNCNTNVASAIVNYTGISVDFIISSNDCINGKPHNEPYDNAIKRYNISNKKCFIFEDSKTGIISGKSVYPKLLIGMETIYNNEELLKIGVNLTIKNYNSFDFEQLINYDNKLENNFVKILKENSVIDNINNIVISNNKLKGGFIADVIKFKITTENNNKYYQILKYENEHQNDLSNMAKQIELYNREYYFYTNISNQVNDIINIPKFYNLIKNNDNKTIGIVLEDLNERNFKLNLNLNLENIDVTLKIIDRMAKMHAHFWNKNLKIEFPELKKSTESLFCPFYTEFINSRYSLFKLRWFNVINEYQQEKCEEIFNSFSEIQSRFSSGNNLTFIHGDIKSPNIFYDNDNEPYFIDWQHCAIGKGVQDLIFFIIESFDIMSLELIFNLTKNYYYKKLLEYGITNYTFKEYEDDIYDAICYIPFFTSVWFGTIPQDQLIDKNFPYFLITKMFYLIKLIR